MNTSTKKRGLRDWIVATRPWSFPASVMPILIMWGFLFYGMCRGYLAVSWLNALLCMPLLVIVHAGGNMVSDYYDYKHKVDLPGGPNGVTWIFDSIFRPKEILWYGVILILTGTGIGIVLLCRSSWEGIWIGIAGLLLAFGYFWMKGHWLGDLNILCSFALLPAIGNMFVSTGQYHWEAMLCILPLGLLTVSILHANNTRDIGNDRRAGLDTISISLGGKAGKKIYLFETVMPYALTLLCCLLLGQPWTLLLVVLTLPIAIRNDKTMMAADDNMEGQIPTLDKSSAQLQMLFGLLYAAGYFIAAAL